MLVTWCTTGMAQYKGNVSESLKHYLTIQQKRIGFNGVVLIAKNDQILNSEIIGKASFELNVPLTINSGFKIASISKTFTAMLVVMAANEGKLHLKDSLATFFPELKEPSWRKITIDQLLSHRSGIPHNGGITDYGLLKSKLALNNQQALDEIFKMKLLFEPGTDVKYTSPGYYLLAAILEKTYQQSYAAILKAKVTNRLNMTRTGVCSTAEIIPGMSASYHLLGDSLIVAPYRDFSLMKGSGDLYATAGDLLKWTSSFFGNTWSNKIKSQIFTDHTSKGVHGNDDHYGYGWFIRPGNKDHKPAYYVGGGTFGCSAITVWYPAEKISIVILSNISVLPTNELWADIEKIIFDQPFELPQLKKDLKLNAGQLKKFEGSYVTAQGMELNITADKEHLYTQLGSNPLFEIYPETALKFYGKKVNVTFTFQVNDEGFINGLVTEGRGKIVTFNKK